MPFERLAERRTCSLPLLVSPRSSDCLLIGFESTCAAGGWCHGWVVTRVSSAREGLVPRGSVHWH